MPSLPGIFAPLSKISKAKDRRKNIAHTPSTKAGPLIRSQKIDVAHVTSKVNTGRSNWNVRYLVLILIHGIPYIASDFLFSYL